MTLVLRESVVLIISVVLAGVLGFGSYAIAKQNGAKSPLNLYDGNGIFLGTIIGIHSYNGDTLYTTYLPGVEGILQFKSRQLAQYDVVLIESVTDCNGDIYAQPQSGATPWTNPWIVKIPGIGYGKISKSPGTTCPDPYQNFAGVYKVTLITLPLDPDNVVLPFSIRE